MRRRIKLLVALVLTLGISQLIILALLFYFNFSFKAEKAKLGVTFSPEQAKYMGLNPRQVLVDSLDDLKIKNYRLSVYWNVFEKQKGRYSFGEIDWQLDEVRKRNGTVILAIGRRLPRWPECHDPSWVKYAGEKEAQDRILKMLGAVVGRYQNRPEIKAWQIENEPFLKNFGECPPLDRKFLADEVALVKSLDSRPIIITESGELSSWTGAIGLADWVGVSLYRTAWNKLFGFFYYPLTPAYYKYRSRSILPAVKKIFVSELQAEPWGKDSVPLPETPIEEQKILMDENRILASIEFAKRAGFDEIYLWGVEWWAYLKTHGDNKVWNAIKQAVLENN